MPRTRLTVHETEPGVLVVTGEIDAHSAPTLEEQLRSMPGGDVSIDMSGVEFMDSSGLRILVVERKRRSSEGGRLTVADASAAVTRLLALVGLTDLFEAESRGA